MFLPTGVRILQTERKIPKSAIEPLTKYCKKLEEETGRPVAEIFREYLELMKKYGDFFFDDPWPEEREKRLELKDKEMGFIEEGGSLEEKCERLTVICLRRNISIQGFDSEGFNGDFEFYGGWECHDCSVPEAMDLRETVEQEEEFRREIQEKMKLEEPGWFAREMSVHLKKPEVIEAEKTRVVELMLYEYIGGAEGKSCEVKNKYKCPYGEESKELIRYGKFVGSLWHEIQWYDHNFDEPALIDMTSYDDIIKAIKDGRMDKIIEEHKKYMKETGREVWQY